MQPEQRRPSRLAVTFVVVGLALSALGIAYLSYAGRARRLPSLLSTASAPAHRAKVERIGEAKALMRMLLHSSLLFLAFVFGSYLIVRIGRDMLDRRAQRAGSEYVDAWSHYRLTQEEIDTATGGLEDDIPPESPPGDSQREPPETPGEPS